MILPMTSSEYQNISKYVEHNILTWHVVHEINPIKQGELQKHEAMQTKLRGAILNEYIGDSGN